MKQDWCAVFENEQNKPGVFMALTLIYCFNPQKPQCNSNGKGRRFLFSFAEMPFVIATGGLMFFKYFLDHEANEIL